MLDFTKVKKSKLPIKLPNGETLILTMPQKKTFEKMAAMEDGAADNGSEVAVDEMYQVATEILSNNLQKKRFTVDEVGEMFDIEDLTMIYTEYSKFASGVKTDPN